MPKYTKKEYIRAKTKWTVRNTYGQKEKIKPCKIETIIFEGEPFRFHMVKPYCEICEHDVLKHLCYDCHAKIGICKHLEDKFYCVECCGGGVCKHRQRWDSCEKCRKKYICHHRKRHYCRFCHQRLICEQHKELKKTCEKCIAEKEATA